MDVDVVDEAAILSVQVTLEGIVKLLERVTSVHCRAISINLRDCLRFGLPERGHHHHRCTALEWSHSPRPWHQRSYGIEHPPQCKLTSPLSGRSREEQAELDQW